MNTIRNHMHKKNPFSLRCVNTFTLVCFRFHAVLAPRARDPARETLRANVRLSALLVGR